ncbi:MAG: CXXX repeat peptide modification system protein [Muribaculaceae bacterium]|nr:CXXX repeat peptide modification system protein [Muribaculaceae bacterium]
MVTKEKVGQVTAEECAEIKQLFERRNGLVELVKIITPDNDALYEKVVADMGATATKFQQWWNEKAAKYQWKSHPNGNWEINFDTCEVFLLINQ